MSALGTIELESTSNETRLEDLATPEKKIIIAVGNVPRAALEPSMISQ